MIHKLTSKILLCLPLLCAAAPGSAQVSGFAANEARALSAKDGLRGIRTTLKEGSPGALRHSAAISAAFKDTDYWAPAVETYYALKTDLVARAAALEAKLDAAIARNAPERAKDTTKALDELGKKVDVLRSDYEFYMKLPRLAAGPQRRAAQAAMCLLAQTGDYPVTLAYFLDKTPHRPPFSPLPPGVMSIRHR